MTSPSALDPRAPVRRGLPQLLQRAVAAAGLVAGAPVLAVCALAVRLSSPGPILFRQTRVGRGGRPFTLYKFRTMVPNAQATQITASGDPRITRVGRWLRASKLDELPQLLNVLEGTMSLVGPRPEVPRHVDLEDPLWQGVLEAEPGITSPMSTRLRDEEALMAQLPPEERDRFYAQSLQRYKLLGDLAYLQRRNALSDLGVIARTALAVAAPGARPQPSPEEVADLARRGVPPLG